MGDWGFGEEIVKNAEKNRKSCYGCNVQKNLSPEEISENMVTNRKICIRPRVE